MRASVVFESVNIQRLSAVAARPYMAAGAPMASVAVIFPVLGSARTSVLLPQFAIQSEPNAEIGLEQGWLRFEIGSRSLLVFASIWISEFVEELAIRMLGAAKAIAPGDSTANCASALRLAKGIWTPGVFKPAAGGAGAAD